MRKPLINYLFSNLPESFTQKERSAIGEFSIFVWSNRRCPKLDLK